MTSLRGIPGTTAIPCRYRDFVITTFQALAVVALALLPGGLYTWAFERQAGAWGIGLSDRLLRLVGWSAIFHVLAAPLSYELYRQYIYSGRLRSAEALPPWIWLVSLLYVAIPIAVGWLVGDATRARKPWSQLITGPSPAPRAWDHLFSIRDLEGWVRIRLKSGGWLIGAYARADAYRIRSYAAGYPEQQDLFLADTAECDGTTGEFYVDADGNPMLRGVAMLLRWDEVAYLEFIEA